MLSNYQLALLLDFSLSFSAEKIDSLDIKSFLEKLVRSLNCNGGRIYYLVDGAGVYDFSLEHTLPKYDQEMDDYLNENFWKDGQLDKEDYKSIQSQYPFVDKFNGHYYHMFELQGVGFIVLRSHEEEIENAFTVTLNDVFDKFSNALQKKRMEQQILLTSHLVNLGSMASSIGHEIKNPLAVLKGANTVISLSIKKQKYDNLEKQLDTADRSVTRIANIVESIKALSRDESDLPLGPVNVKCLLEDCDFFSKAIINSSSVKVEFPTDIPEDLEFMGRSVPVSQVIVNLVKNGIEEIAKTPDPWVKVVLEHDETCIRFKIIDCGPGIPEEIAKKIMTPFFTTKEKGVGTGIGLSLSKEIIDAQGGKLYYDPTGENTTFVVEFSVLTKEAAA